jgi:hypothetical protein
MFYGGILEPILEGSTFMNIEKSKWDMSLNLFYAAADDILCSALVY